MGAPCSNKKNACFQSFFLIAKNKAYPKSIPSIVSLFKTNYTLEASCTLKCYSFFL